jgi:hypothetical protein
MIKNPNRRAGRRLSLIHEALPATNPEIVHYFEERSKRIKSVKTTRTPSGQILDWIPIQSQHPEGRIATPPPAHPVRHFAAEHNIALAGFELHDPAVERGPSGTVPVARKDFSRLHATCSLKQYLSKARARSRLDDSFRSDADPDPYGYFHAMCSQSVTCYGADGVLNVWMPYVENSSDHTLAQVGLSNYSGGNPQRQTIEAGWEISHDQYSDWSPHLFVFFTTK